MSTPPVGSSLPKEKAYILKGIMQMIIVMSHLHFTVGKSIFPFMLANKLATSVVALFFFVSGFGLTASILLKKPESNSWRGFFTRRLWGIILPFLVVLGLHLLINPPSLAITELLHNWVYNGVTPLPNAWFICVLCYLYLAFYLSFRWRGSTKSHSHTLLPFLTLFFLSVVAIIVPIVLDYERAWWATTLAFASGVAYAYWEKSIYSWLSSYGIIFVLLSIVAILFSGVELLLPLAFMGIPLVIVRLINISYFSPPVNKLTSFLSRISYELYLIHGVVIYSFDSYELFRGNNYLLSLAVILTSIAAATLIHFAIDWVQRKLSPNKSKSV